MLAAHEIEEVLKSNSTSRIAEAHVSVFGTEINRNCGECINDAKIHLRKRLNEIEREKAPIHILVGVYAADNPKRQDELDECLYQNKNSPAISKVIEITGDRPTFQDFFNLFEEETINVIVNSDIFFDETIQLAKGIKPNGCYALTRYDWNGNGHAKFVNRFDSQDTWIFRGKIKKPMYADFSLGVPGCDNRIAWEIKKAGYVITNPSLSIHALHYHSSGVRSYTVKTPAVPQPYHFVHPCVLT